MVARGFRPLRQTYRENALKQVFSYFSRNQEELKRIVEAGAHFDGVVRKIRARQFDVKNPPDARVCKDCDFRFYCSEKEVIKFKAKELVWEKRMNSYNPLVYEEKLRDSGGRYGKKGTLILK